MRYYAFEIDGGEVIVESGDTAAGTGPVSSGGHVAKTEERFDEVMGQLNRILPSLRKHVHESLADASEVKVEFGLKLAGKLGLVIASTDVEANFKVSVAWAK